MIKVQVYWKSQHLLSWYNRSVLLKKEVSFPFPLLPVQQTLVLVRSFLELIQLTNLTWNCLSTFLIVSFCVVLLSWCNKEKGIYTQWGGGSWTFYLLLTVKLAAISEFHVFLNKVIYLLQILWVDILWNTEKLSLAL